jgi:hypothetical protein
MLIDKALNRGYVLSPLGGTSPPPGEAGLSSALRQGGKRYVGPLPAAVEATTGWPMSGRPDGPGRTLGFWAIGAARDSAVGAVRRHLGTSIDARADYCFDPGASTKAASTRCALVANGRCAATRGPRLAFTLPHGYHERGARGWLCPIAVARRLRRGCCSRARKHPGSWLAPMEDDSRRR